MAMKCLYYRLKKVGVFGIVSPTLDDCILSDYCKTAMILSVIETFLPIW